MFSGNYFRKNSHPLIGIGIILSPLSPITLPESALVRAVRHSPELAIPSLFYPPPKRINPYRSGREKGIGRSRLPAVLLPLVAPYSPLSCAWLVSPLIQLQRSVVDRMIQVPPGRMAVVAEKSSLSWWPRYFSFTKLASFSLLPVTCSRKKVEELSQGQNKKKFAHSEGELPEAG